MRGGGLELRDALTWGGPPEAEVRVVVVGGPITRGLGRAAGGREDAPPCARACVEGGACAGPEGPRGMVVGVGSWVEVAGWSGGMVMDAGGRESLNPGIKERTDKPEARRKAVARPLMPGDARLEMLRWERERGVPGG